MTLCIYWCMLDLKCFSLSGISFCGTHSCQPIEELSEVGLISSRIWGVQVLHSIAPVMPLLSVCLSVSLSLSLSPPLLSSPHRLHVSRWWCNIAGLLPFKAETNLWREKRRGVYLWHPTVLSSPSASSSQLLSQLYRCEWHRWLFRHWSSWWGDKGYIVIM